MATPAYLTQTLLLVSNETRWHVSPGTRREKFSQGQTDLVITQVIKVF